MNIYKYKTHLTHHNRVEIEGKKKHCSGDVFFRSFYGNHSYPIGLKHFKWKRNVIITGKVRRNKKKALQDIMDVFIPERECVYVSQRCSKGRERERKSNLSVIAELKKKMHTKSYCTAEYEGKRRVTIRIV